MDAGLRILYVEDDPGLARLVQMRLAPEGYQVDIATTGQEGLLAFDETIHDLVIVDYQLPDGNGSGSPPEPRLAQERGACRHGHRRRQRGDRRSRHEAGSRGLHQQGKLREVLQPPSVGDRAGRAAGGDRAAEASRGGGPAGERGAAALHPHVDG